MSDVIEYDEYSQIDPNEDAELAGVGVIEEEAPTNGDGSSIGVAIPGLKSRKKGSKGKKTAPPVNSEDVVVTLDDLAETPKRGRSKAKADKPTKPGKKPREEVEKPAKETRQKKNKVVDVVSEADIQSFEEACEFGRHLAENEAANKWQLGDLAGRIPAIYGKKTMEAFAARIGLAKTTVQKYRWVAGIWSLEEREHFGGRLTFSHFQQLTQLKSVSPTLALEIAEAAAFGEEDGSVWSVDRLRHELAPKDKNKKVQHITIPLAFVTNVDPDGEGGSLITLHIQNQGYEQWEKAFKDHGMMDKHPVHVRFSTIDTEDTSE